MKLILRRNKTDRDMVEIVSMTKRWGWSKNSELLWAVISSDVLYLNPHGDIKISEAFDKYGEITVELILVDEDIFEGGSTKDDGPKR